MTAGSSAVSARPAERKIDMRIVVTVDPAALADIDAVARRLVRAGMTVDQILSATGIITGSADDAVVPGLGGLAGIVSVESDTDFRTPSGDP